jgi:predicted enzyme related to lactoylglutathione lyase
MIEPKGNAMAVNRSVPVDTILPHVVYQNVAAAIDWLNRTFGFVKHYHYGQKNGAQMHLGNAWIMLRESKPGAASPAKLGYGTQSLTVFIDDVDAHHQKAKTAGAKILEEPHETEYGEYQYAAEDLDGHHWLFSRHAKDVSPDEWGATVAEKLQPKNANQIDYAEFPAIDIEATRKFYEAVFGWKFEDYGPDYTSFFDGRLAGGFTTDIPNPAKGLLVVIYATDLDDVQRKIKAARGAIVKDTFSFPGGRRFHFTDPNGNELAVWSE